MKVIAQTSDGFLLEASAWEIARLMGDAHGANRVGVGTRFNVSKAWDRMEGLKRRDNVPALVNRLRSIANLLEGEEEFVTGLAVEIGAADQERAD